MNGSKKRTHADAFPKSAPPALTLPDPAVAVPNKRTRRAGPDCHPSHHPYSPKPPVSNPPYSCKFTIDPALDDLPDPTDEDVVYNKAFMEAALAEAWKAFDAKEVPVGAVFVRGGKIVCRVHNLTNEERNATRHCEIIGVDVIIRDFKKKYPDIKDLSGFCIYVTCEPCIMCASALRMVRIRKVFFGCHNDKFGGLGSVLKLHERQIDVNDHYEFEVYGGILESRCVNVLRTFYERGNPKLPPEKRHRRTKISEKGKRPPPQHKTQPSRKVCKPKAPKRTSSATPQTLPTKTTDQPSDSAALLLAEVCVHKTTTISAVEHAQACATRKAVASLATNGGGVKTNGGGVKTNGKAGHH